MKDTFFVGYLPTPPSLGTFYRWLIPCLVLLALAAGGISASLQQAAGNGTWQLGAPATLTGKLRVDPYPVLHLADGSSVFLVVQGKRGADELALPHDGTMVSVSGNRIERGGWTMLEIADANAFAESGVADVAAPINEVLGPDRVYGEIVDSKCFLGVMKPGEGKVHRACAALCLLGGMPPVFVARDLNGNQFGYVLINADGSSAASSLAPQVAIPMEVTGQFERRGDLTYLRLRSGDRSLTPLAGAERRAFGPSIAMNNSNPAFCGVMNASATQSWDG